MQDSRSKESFLNNPAPPMKRLIFDVGGPEREINQLILGFPKPWNLDLARVEKVGLSATEKTLCTVGRCCCCDRAV